MLLSFALILLTGMISGWICSKVKLPPLIGMLIAGIVLGPYCMNLIDSSVLEISSDIRRIALIIILIRAGLNLKTEDLLKAGRPAVLMCFVPAVFEIIGMVLLAPVLLGLNLLDSLILGTVIAAVSPAVIVPHMLKVMEEGYGTEKGIPQMILAGASADDVFVIVLFSSFTAIALGGSFNPAVFLRIPTSILLGIAGGGLMGFLLSKAAEKICIDNAASMTVMLCICFLLVTLEDVISGIIGFSGLIAVIAMNMMLAAKQPELSSKLSAGFSSLWQPAQIFLFVLVGAAVDIRYAAGSWYTYLLLITGVLLFRMAGVAVCMIGTELNRKERLFCMLAYTPKATVQAAIGAIPLSYGLSCGNTVLSAAVIAILFTAPSGAFLIDLTYRKLLSKNQK